MSESGYLRSNVSLTVIGAFVLVACMWSSEGKEHVSRRGEHEQEMPDLRLVADGGEVVNVFFQESFGESDQGEISGRHSSGQQFVYEIGCVTLGFANPCILETSDHGLQAAIVPYRVGGGTGVGVFHWVLVGTKNGSLYAKDMGVWESYVILIGQYSREFQLSPYLSKRGPRGEVVLQFLFLDQDEKRTKAIEGRVLLKLSLQNKEVVARLVPFGKEDARACVALLSENSVAYVDEWSASVVESICPELTKEGDYKRFGTRFVIL